MQTRPHKLVYYQDGRHSHLYQFEPPMSKQQLELVVDEIAGTPIDTMIYCTGDGTTQLYDTKVGELWGHNKKAWGEPIFYRAGVNVRRCLAAGLDPMRVTCDRAHEYGISFFPELRLQAPNDPNNTSGRASDFWINNAHLAIGPYEGLDERQVTALDFAHDVVREERFAIVNELVENYPVDGVELGISYYYPYFKPPEVEKHTPLFTDWVRRIRRRLDEVGQGRGQLLELAVRVPGSVAACRQIGVDIETWVREGLVNLISPDALDGTGDYAQQDLDVRPFVQLTRGTGIQVCGVFGGRVWNDENHFASLPHYRAGVGNLWSQGVDGILLPFFWARWPYTDEAYAILRELPYPQVMAWGDKHYFAPTVTSRGGAPSKFFGYERPLPRTLSQGQTAEISLPVSDDLPEAEAQGRLIKAVLHLRLAGAGPDDVYEVRLNGSLLPAERLEKRDFTYYMRAPQYMGEIGYWYDYQLDAHHWPRPGENRIAVTASELMPDLAYPRKLSDVELTIEYRPARNWRRWSNEPLPLRGV